ncbi:MAG: hypothetical protein KDK08_01360 [Rhizobiaceae bacterium]|nr:hypothetical protein [Rhizobiaceae bacterium]
MAFSGLDYPVTQDDATLEAGGYSARMDHQQYHVAKLSGVLVSASDFDSWEILTREVFSGIAS